MGVEEEVFLSKAITVNTIIKKDGFQGCYYQASNTKMAVIILGGSDGGKRIANATAQKIFSNGISSLAVFYFRTMQTGFSLSRIEVETVERAVSWLKIEGLRKLLFTAYPKEPSLHSFLLP